MKRSVLLILLLSVVTLGGCDMFRKIAGRPTSDELDLKRLRIEAQQAEIDSLKAEHRKLTDSLAMVDSLRQLSGTVLNLSELGGLYTTSLDFKYYIIVGSFRNRTYAENLLVNVAGYGYAPVLICFRNGLFAVGISPENRVEAAVKSLKAVKNEEFCPSDVWILVNE
ncbi:MAG: SPOR domain-containing protein [Bacteroidales bacterium]|nr:SPOR domain-containing protein [Bacteroides sp.]MCM1197328.1 SPOR domain-containing protein [Clostridium sp.]MCM1501852.1 SPOR domain-containing protein [Bacteroidales bacterium]